MLEKKLEIIQVTEAYCPLKKTREQIRAEVLDTLGERILKALEKLTAREERELRKMFSNIPEGIYRPALTKLVAEGLVVRAVLQDLTMVALTGATPEQLQAAVETHRYAEWDSRITRKFNRDIYQAKEDGRREPARFAQAMPLDNDDLHRPEEGDTGFGGREGNDLHGLTWEQARVADPFEAEIPANLDREYHDAAPVNRHLRRQVLGSMGRRKLELVAKQIQTRQGERNARRAMARWMNSPEGLLWKKAREQNETLEKILA